MNNLENALVRVLLVDDDDDDYVLTKYLFEEFKDNRYELEWTTGYDEAFIEELKGFWSAIVEGTPVRNTAEHARRDMALLLGLAQWHATHMPLAVIYGDDP